VKRHSSIAEQMIRQQRRALRAVCGRLDLVQRDAEMALVALTEAEARIADLEARVFATRRPASEYAAMLGVWVPPVVAPEVTVGAARRELETNQKRIRWDEHRP